MDYLSRFRQSLSKGIEYLIGEIPIVARYRKREKLKLVMRQRGPFFAARTDVGKLEEVFYHNELRDLGM